MKSHRTTRWLAAALGLTSLGAGLLHNHRITSARGVPLSGPKLLAGALAPIYAAVGAAGALLGACVGAPVAFLTGVWGALTSYTYIRDVRRAAQERATSLDANWPDRLPREPELPHAKQLYPGEPEPDWEQDLPFATIPGTDRALLCDIWQPAPGVKRSGLGIIYLHGSGWHFLDKDVGTRPLFHHLTAQGHVVMDVAYRLCPEVTWREMAGDPRRAIRWFKAHAADYGVDARSIVLAGGSAGGHLALLAAYTPDTPSLTPEDLVGQDTRVAGVISWYGPTDMRVYYTYAGTAFNTPVAPSSSQTLTDRMMKAMGFEMNQPETWQPGQTVQEAMMCGLMGGTPDEVPEAYRLFSPVEHVDGSCPPTLLLQGAHDMIVSPEAVHEMAQKLNLVGAPVTYVAYPKVEHAFDLILPTISPSARAATHEVDRFLSRLRQLNRSAGS